MPDEKLYTVKMRKTAPPPSQFTAIIDTREQTPFNLHPLRTVRGTLETGDYSILGLEHHVRIERKSLQDLVQCVGRERERFEANVSRLLAYPVRALIIEASYTDIEMQKWRGKISKEQVHGSIAGWIVRGLNVTLADSPEMASIQASRILYIAARREYEKLEKLTRNLREEEKLSAQGRS